MLRGILLRFFGNLIPRPLRTSAIQDLSGFWKTEVKLGVLILVTGLFALIGTQPARAANVDPYVFRYLQVREPIELNLDTQGNTRQFSAEDLAVGKQLFSKNCLNCHVGGSTLPNPMVSLSLADLEGASPPRNTINGLVEYLRHPLSYNGQEETFWCREVPESWMPQEQVEKLAAFVLRAAQKAPGWGVETFEE